MGNKPLITASPRVVFLIKRAAIIGSILIALFAITQAPREIENWRAQFPSNISSIADAQRYVLGTWTFVDPIDLARRPYAMGWVKWEFKPDGTAFIYEANPKDVDWGKPQVLKYEAFTDKFYDTGERYYAVKFYVETRGYTDMFGIIESDGSLSRRYRGADEMTLHLHRGDRFPFSP